MSNSAISLSLPSPLYDAKPGQTHQEFIELLADNSAQNEKFLSLPLLGLAALVTLGLVAWRAVNGTDLDSKAGFDITHQLQQGNIRFTDDNGQK
jgi:hypothetical protein